MDVELENGLRELLDRQAITDCLMRYCRGVDRFDRELLLSAYHPDAMDDHGIVVLGPEEFADWVFELQAKTRISHRHCITNVALEIEGDVAHGETYYTVFSEAVVKPNMITNGRYLDRFERRSGRWAIAARVCLTDVVYQVESFDFTPQYRELIQGNGIAKRSREDLSYVRPLQVVRPRQR